MKEKIKIRYPNDDSYVDVYINEISFIRQKIMGNLVFGYCNSDYVAMSINDYNKYKDVKNKKVL